MPATANATTTCDSALCVWSSALETLPTPTTTAPITLTSCSLSMVHESTLTNPYLMTLMPTPVCNCNEGKKPMVAVETLVGGDNKLYTNCVVEVGKSSFLLGSSEAPAPTPTLTGADADSCWSITTMPAHTLNGMSIAEDTFCTCGATMAGINTITGSDGAETMVCAVGPGNQIPVVTQEPSTSTTTSAAPSASSCRLYYEETWSDDGVDVSYAAVLPNGQNPIMPAMPGSPNLPEFHLVTSEDVPHGSSPGENITESTNEYNLVLYHTGFPFDVFATFNKPALFPTTGDLNNTGANFTANDEPFAGWRDLKWHAQTFSPGAWFYRGKYTNDPFQQKTVCFFDCHIPIPENKFHPSYESWCTLDMVQTIPHLEHGIDWYDDDGGGTYPFPVHLSASLSDDYGYVLNGTWSSEGYWHDQFIITANRTGLPYNITIYVDGTSQTHPGGVLRRNSDNGWQTDGDGADGYWQYTIPYYKHFDLDFYVWGDRGAPSLYYFNSNNKYWYLNSDEEPDRNELWLMPSCSVDWGDYHYGWKDCDNQDECTAQRKMRCRWLC